jgi:hypothetical protein
MRKGLRIFKADKSWPKGTKRYVLALSGGGKITFTQDFREKGAYCYLHVDDGRGNLTVTDCDRIDLRKFARAILECVAPKTEGGK